MARTGVRRRGIYIEGLEELDLLFNQLPDVANKILEQATEEAAKIVMEDAVANVAVDTGKLRAHIRLKHMKLKRKTQNGWCINTKGVRYGFAVEYGTTKIKAQPFMRPAFDKNEAAVKAKISEVILNEIDKVWGRA